MSVLDELLFGDPARRMASGLALVALGSVLLAWLEWRVRRRGESYLDHRGLSSMGFAFVPIGVAVMISAPWGLLGVAVFLGVAIVVCGVGAVAMLLRGDF